MITCPIDTGILPCKINFTYNVSTTITPNVAQMNTIPTTQDTGPAAKDIIAQRSPHIPKRKKKSSGPTSPASPLGLPTLSRPRYSTNDLSSTYAAIIN